MIDSSRIVAYIAASALGLAFLLPGSARAEDKEHLGALIPKRAKKIGEDRFRSPWGWDSTKRWLDRNYKSWEYPRIRIINKPGIKAIHIRNGKKKKKKSKWSGINMYELRTGEVRFYVLERLEDEKKKE